MVELGLLYCYDLVDVCVYNNVIVAMIMHETEYGHFWKCMYYVSRLCR